MSTRVRGAIGRIRATRRSAAVPLPGVAAVLRYAALVIVLRTALLPERLPSLQSHSTSIRSVPTNESVVQAFRSSVERSKVRSFFFRTTDRRTVESFYKNGTKTEQNVNVILSRTVVCA